MANQPTAVDATRVILDNADIIKSPTDQRHYRIIELGNALRCVLVHEANAHQASAALAVAAGHFHDPQQAQGLAHFLEHMLFLGTEKYPGAQDYHQFISAHGGNHNAWTGTEFSNYYFNVDADSFAPALDRFTRFFYQPLLSQHWVNKELQSIESEFQLKRQDELRRLYQVHKATANPNHPFSKFSVGNLTTLMDKPETTLAQQLRHFFQRWYCARRMTLVLVGPHSLAELQALAEQYAGPIQSGCADILHLNQPLYLPEQLGVELHVRPLKDARRLIVSFALPSINDDYANKTTSYIAHILGYEGPGSLFSYLRDKHWVNSLAAGGGISGGNFKDFNINMQLTEQGMRQRNQIIAAIFSYLQLIRAQGLEAWRYQERRVSVMNAFNFQEPPRGSDLAPQLAINLQHYLAEDVVFGDYRMDGLFLPKAHEFLEHMVPTNMRLTVIHQHLKTNQIEPIYGSEYALRPLSKEQLELFNQPPAIPVKLPAANPYLAEPWQLTTTASTTVSKHPQMQQPAPGLLTWHLQDCEFQQPKAHLYIGFYLPQVIDSPAHFAQARLWCELLLDVLNEACYDAEIAGLHFNLYPQQQGLTLHVSGPARYVPELTKTIIETLASSLSQQLFSQQRWLDLRQRILSNWRQALLHKPMNLLFSHLNVQLQPHTYSVFQLAEELEQIEFDQFVAELPALFEHAGVYLFAHGDLTNQQIQPLQQQLQQWLGLQKPLTIADLNPLPLAKLQANRHLSTQHSDHAVIALIQSLQTDARQQGLFMLINQLLQPRFFSQLRTEQQLGYLVGATYLPMQQHPHLLFYVQSSNQHHGKIIEAIEQFFAAIPDLIADIDDAEFALAKQSLTQQLTEKDTSLRVRSQRLWSAITQQDHDFSRLNRIAAAIADMSLKDFSTQTKQLINNSSNQMFLSAAPADFDTPN